MSRISRRDRFERFEVFKHKRLDGEKLKKIKMDANAAYSYSQYVGIIFDAIAEEKIINQKTTMKDKIKKVIRSKYFWVSLLLIAWAFLIFDTAILMSTTESAMLKGFLFLLSVAASVTNSLVVLVIFCGFSDPDEKIRSYSNKNNKKCGYQKK